MDIRTTLTLNGRSYDVDLFVQCFYRLVGWRGNLLSHYPDDGDLYVSMEAPNDYFILELMLKDEDKPRARGCIEIYDGLGDLPVRRIQFNEAYIISYRETFNPKGDGGMTAYLHLSPQNMLINSSVNMARKFSGRWIEEEEEPMSVKEVDTVPEVCIINAYWIKPDGTMCKEIPFNHPVKLYIKVVNHNAGQDLSFEFEEETDEGVYHASCSGKADADGIVIIEYFEFKKE